MATTYGEMADAGEPINLLFDRMLELWRARREAPIKNRLWTHTWTHEGRDWLLKMNGHVDGVEVEGVPAMHCALECDGWLRALFDMFHGSTVGGVETEDLCVAALNGAIEQSAAMQE